MLRACLDTNVWISGLIFSGPPQEIVEFAFRKRFHSVLSTFILDELERNLSQKFGVTPKAAARFRYRIAQVSDIFEPTGVVDEIPEQRGDNLVLETAWLGKARYLVTGDHRHLLPLKTFKHTKIIEPNVFLNVLKRT